MLAIRTVGVEIHLYGKIDPKLLLTMKAVDSVAASAAQQSVRLSVCAEDVS